MVRHRQQDALVQRGREHRQPSRRHDRRHADRHRADVHLLRLPGRSRLGQVPERELQQGPHYIRRAGGLPDHQRAVRPRVVHRPDQLRHIEYVQDQRHRSGRDHGAGIGKHRQPAQPVLPHPQHHLRPRRHARHGAALALRRGHPERRPLRHGPHGEHRRLSGFQRVLYDIVAGDDPGILFRPHHITHDRFRRRLGACVARTEPRHDAAHRHAELRHHQRLRTDAASDPRPGRTAAGLLRCGPGHRAAHEGRAEL